MHGLCGMSRLYVFFPCADCSFFWALGTPAGRLVAPSHLRHVASCKDNQTTFMQATSRYVARYSFPRVLASWPACYACQWADICLFAICIQSPTKCATHCAV